MTFPGLSEDEYGQALSAMGQPMPLAQAPVSQGPDLSPQGADFANASQAMAQEQEAADAKRKGDFMKKAASAVGAFFTGGASLAATGAAGAAGGAAATGAATGSALGAAAAPTAGVASSVGNAAVSQAVGQVAQQQALQGASEEEQKKQGIGSILGMFGG
jgi:hypothetical protein